MKKTYRALREILMLGLSVIISILLTNVQRDFGGDAGRYLDMTEGGTAEMPWGSRILIPRIIGFLFAGDYSMAWHIFNVIVFGIAIYIFVKNFGSIPTALFLICCYGVIESSIGEPLLDASIFLFLAIGVYLVQRNKWLEMNILFTLSIMLHPIASVFLLIMSLNLKQQWCTLPYQVGLMLLTLPLGYSSFMQVSSSTVCIVIACLNLLCLSIFTIRRDRQSLLFVLMLIATFGFVLLATDVPRMVYFVGPFMAHRLIEYCQDHIVFHSDPFSILSGEGWMRTNTKIR